MDIIVKPIITEKITKMTENFPNRFGFIVDRRANKIEIGRAVEEPMLSNKGNKCFISSQK